MVVARVAKVTAFLSPFKGQGIDFCAGGDYQSDLKSFEGCRRCTRRGYRCSHMGSEFESARTPTDFEQYNPTLVEVHEGTSLFTFKRLCSFVRCENWKLLLEGMPGGGMARSQEALQSLARASKGQGI
jgi:hypothetical protein